MGEQTLSIWPFQTVSLEKAGLLPNSMRHKNAIGANNGMRNVVYVRKYPAEPCVSKM